MVFLKLKKKYSENLKINFHFKNKKNVFGFHAYNQILKVFHAYFLKKWIKSPSYHVLRNAKINIVTGL
jgi:hypothetical protein